MSVNQREQKQGSARVDILTLLREASETERIKLNTIGAIQRQQRLVRQAAQAYAQLGLRPMSAIGKAPNRKYKKEATSDPAKVAKLFNEQRKLANVTIVTGKVVFGFECDPKDDGDKSLAALIKQHGALPETWESQSGSGGSHFFFAWPDDFTVHSSAGEIGDGIDIRGFNGIMVEWPSIHQKTGRRYRWKPGRSPWEIPLATAPDWLLDRLRKQADRIEHGKPTTSTSGRLDMPLIDAGVPEGQRDEQLFLYACFLRGQDRPREETEKQVLAAAARCQPPFPDNEALKKVEQAWKYPPGEVPEDSDDENDYRGPYSVKDDCLYVKRYSRKGEPLPDQQLTNFDARIINYVTHDDGSGDLTSAFEIEVKLGERWQGIVMVPADEYDAMHWATAKLHADALIHSGTGIRDHVRAGIKRMSEPIPSRTIYDHSGWDKINDEWAFLFEGGAIGAHGALAGIDVKLHNSLKALVLALPDSRAQLKQAIKASLGIIDLAPERISAVLLGTAYRAPLPSPINFTVWLRGNTQLFKTSAAMLIQQHFGGEFSEHEVLTWLSTATFSEALAHAAANVSLLIDDFVPGGSAIDRLRSGQQAERFVRGVGNSSGRGRGRADGSTRPLKVARCLPLSTGEDVLGLQSSRARMVIAEVGLGDIRLPVLTRCQQDARAGLYALAVGAFVRWLASRHDRCLAAVKRLLPMLREYLPTGRTSDNLDQLAIGWVAFLAFALGAKALTMVQAQKLWARVWAGLVASGEGQRKQQREANPVLRFATLVGSAIASGRAHLQDQKGRKPSADEMLANAHFPPVNQRVASDAIGWLNRQGDLYIDLDAALRAARVMDTEFYISPSMLTKQLDEQGWLASSDITVKGRNTHYVRRYINGQYQNVLHIKPQLLGQAKEEEKPAVETPKVKVPSLASLMTSFRNKE